MTLVYDAGATRRVLLGRPNGSRLEIGGAAAGLGIDVRQEDLEVSAGLELRQLAAIVTAGELDGFLGMVLGGATVVIPISLGLTWSSKTGFKFTGEAGFEVVLHPNLRLGPVSVDALLLGLRSGVAGDGTPQVALAAGVGLSGALGPVSFAVDGLGIALDLRFTPGNAGPLSVRVGLRPPSGLGLAINAGPVAGGGFIAYDEAAGRYFGVFAVSVGPVSVTAIGMLDTRLPGGQRGFSLFIMLAARFSGIQLGYGFMLTGVGGALGVNRRFDTDALLERFASGTVGHILAPENPVRDAPTLLGELSAVFPTAEGVFVVGPTVQITWLDVVKVDLGIFIELPDPTKIVLLGVVRAVLEYDTGEGPVLQLRCDLVGVLDFPRALLSFDAVLVDSTLLEVFTLTGGIAFRLSWGAEPYVLLSVGGFHPGFNPAPVVLPPSLTRMAMRYAPADTGLTLRLEGYFAITTNTLQLGARIDAAIDFGPLSARGFLAFEVLIQFQPFAFQFDFEARMEIRWRGRTLAGLRVKGSMAGPGPTVFGGEVSIEILLFSISAHATFELGSEAAPAVTPVPSALDELAAELADRANLSAIGGDPLVGLRDPEAATSAPVLPPTGQLVWRQRRAPLGLLLERFEGAPLARAETVTAASPLAAGPEDDWFAPGGFAALSDAEALNQPAFERLPGGIRLGAGAAGGSSAVTHQVTVEEYLLPEEQPASAAAFGADPRGRVVAGLGARLAVALQDELSTEAERQAGALGVAANRLRDLSVGLAAAGTLWERRLPADPARALWLVGPALRRVATDRGTAAALLTAPDRPQPPGWTSTAAWRVLRRGPARTALAEPDASDPARLQEAANRCPPPSPFRETGLPSFDLLGAGDFEDRRRDIAGGALADPQGPRDALAALDLSRWPRFQDLLDALRRRVDEAVGAGRPLPRVRIAVLLGLLGTGEDDSRFDRERVEEELPRLVDGFEQAADAPQVVRELLDGLGDEPEEPQPCRPHDLGAVAGEVVGVFDPTRPDAPAVRAVLETVIGLDPAQPLTPPEPCPGLDLPMWRHLAQLEPDWLLPGVGQLPEDSVIAAETNAAFADAFLAGCNTRLVGELRWRNIRIAAGCTPLRAFWSRSDPTSGARVTDIVGIHQWAATSGLGAAQHRPAGIGGQDLVLVFRTRLLERYPGTVLWLVSAEHNGQVDFTQGPDPAAPKRLPTFQGNLGAGVSYFGFQGLPSGDIVRMWLVLEEAPGGYGFRNDEPTADGAAFADIAFDDPVRVLYRGDRLTTGGP